MKAIGAIEEARIAVVRQIGSGLQALHQRGVLHRDVKPANVLFRDDGSPEHNYVPAVGSSQGQRNRWIDDGQLKGVLLEGTVSQPIAEGQGQWCIATDAGLEVQRCSRWNPTGTGAELVSIGLKL